VYAVGVLVDEGRETGSSLHVMLWKETSGNEATRLCKQARTAEARTEESSIPRLAPFWPPPPALTFSQLYHYHSELVDLYIIVSA
jgi:hypothetical protein